MTELSCWRFKAVDTWFFRETRAHDAVGVSELNSVFPPPVRTLFGAIRSWIGDQQGVDWRNFNGSDAHALLGDADTTGALRIAGVQLHVQDDQGAWQRLWPCPANLMQAKNSWDNPAKAPSATITRLIPGPVEHTDLGHVALPEPAAGEAPPGSKVLEGAWLNDTAAAAWLAGKVPHPDDIWTMKDLITHESRLGIARDNARATVMKGQLYQTRHLRFIREVAVELWVKGVPSDALEAAKAGLQTLRVGGEGRMAEVAVSDVTDMALPKPPQAGKPSQLALWFVSPLPLALCDAIAGAPGFRHVQRETQTGKQDSWEGELDGIPLRITANCRPRAYREGGWDQMNRCPKAVRSYLPPGSVLFCECRDDTASWEEIVTALHGHCVGGEPAWGRGQCFVGMY